MNTRLALLPLVLAAPLALAQQAGFTPAPPLPRIAKPALTATLAPAEEFRPAPPLPRAPRPIAHSPGAQTTGQPAAITAAPLQPPRTNPYLMRVQQEGFLPAPALPRTPTVAVAEPAPPARQGEGAPPAERRMLVQAWAEMETVIASPMVGQLVQIPTRAGGRVAKGSPIARFECTENEARAKIAQAELAVANETLASKLRLQAMNAASEIEVTTAAAQVTKAEAQFRLTQHQVTLCTVLAPFDGFVVRVIGKPYQTTTVGQPLLEMISAGLPKLRVSADSRNLRRVKPGSPLRVSIEETGQTYAARVTLINARVDPVNQTFDMEAQVVGAAPGLLPGMSGQAVLSDTPAPPVSTVGLLRPLAIDPTLKSR